MPRIQWTLHVCGRRLLKKISFFFFLVKYSLYSLFYNTFADKYYVGDTCMEPMFWFVDHFTKVLGPICVCGVTILLTSIIVIAYSIGLPFYWKQGLIPTIIALIIGHWILINVLFNYFMAYITLPGFPPQGALIPEAVSICKRCIAPKPPRTHHCSVCNRCVLKMDHHCPWLNNCIGHYNHRYFFMFCIYIWIGVIFVMGFGLPVAWEHYKESYEGINATVTHHNCENTEEVKAEHDIIPCKATILNTTENKRTWREALYHSSIVYAGLLCVAVFIAMGALLAWHSCLISHGETSIEGHINKKERQRLSAEGKVYKNPYDLGPRKNWALFLGIHSRRSWWSIFLPSTHKPFGNGLQWHTDVEVKWLNGKMRN